MSDTSSRSGASRRRSLRIAVRLFDARESWHLSRTLEMAARVAGHAVEMETPAGSADVVFVAPDEPGADAMLNGRAGPGLPLAVAYTAQAMPGVRCLGRPARLQEVRDLLEDLAALAAIASGAGPLPDAPSPAAPEPAARDARTGIPFAVANLDYLLDMLLESRFAGDPLLVRRGEEEFLFLPRHHKVFSRRKAHLEALAEALRAVTRQDVRAIGTADAATLIASGNYHAQPMEAMAWQLAMLAVPKAPLEAGVPEHHLRLKRWPNFAILPHRPCHLQWAARLARGPQPLRTLVAESVGGFDPVARFANACSLLGILDMHAAPACVASPASGAVPAGGGRAGIFQKLLDRLAR